MAPRLLRVLIVGYAALYGLLCWRRFATFHAQIDMSYYLRLIWGIGHGHPALPLVQAPHFLGLHLEPALYPLALLARLGVPLAPLLLSLQAAAVALCAWPAYRLGARHLGAGAPALFCSLLALLYPTVTVATLHDFHPVTLALCPLLFTLDALDEGRFARAILFGAAALCCREDIALQLALLAMLVAVRQRGQGRRRALVVLVALLAYFFTYVLLVQPRYLPPAGSYNLHFANIGGGEARSAPQLLSLVLSHPKAVLWHLLTRERLLYPLHLLLPVALLPLFSPAFLLGALPIVAINLLSDFPRVRTLEAHYTTAIVPFVLASAILGAGRARALVPRLGPAPLLALLSCAFLSHLYHGASPIARYSARYSPANFSPGANDAALRWARASAPPLASVAARPGLLAHLCERPRAISPPEYDDHGPVDWSSTLEP